MSIRCLIVDDDRDFLCAAGDLLERAGISVVGVASTGTQAGQACTELEPDVVLLDINLGEESGFEVARKLAGQAGPDQPCVILISAYSEGDWADMITDSPAVSFLSKAALSGPAVLGILAEADCTPGNRRHHG
jgi:CheY-like chemotaxis protein